MNACVLTYLAYVSIRNGAGANPILNTEIIARQLSALKAVRPRLCHAAPTIAQTDVLRHSKKLATLAIDQTLDFEHLIQAFEVIGQDINRLFNNHIDTATRQYESARTCQAVTTTQDKPPNQGEHE